MELYNKFSAICGLLAVLNFCGTSAAPTAFTQVMETGAVDTVALDASGGTTDLPTTITLAEDFGTGTITTISVTGTDNSGTWASSAPAVAIGASTGVVTVAALDFEAAETTTSTLTFTEGGTGYTIALTLKTTNVVPVFLPLTYAQTVPDGSGASTAITTVTATDVNTAAAPTYAITDGNTDTVFEVTAAGVVQIASNKEVDAATLMGYALAVEADDGALTATTTVIIGVCSSSNALAVTSSLGAILLMAVITILA